MSNLIEGTCTHIQFTTDMEENNSLPLLDILLLHQEDAYMGRLKHLFQFSHINISGLKTIPPGHSHTFASTTEVQFKEDKHVHNALKGNGYSRCFIHSIANQILTQCCNRAV